MKQQAIPAGPSSKFHFQVSSLSQASLQVGIGHSLCQLLSSLPNYFHTRMFVLFCLFDEGSRNRGNKRSWCQGSWQHGILNTLLPSYPHSTYNPTQHNPHCNSLSTVFVRIHMSLPPSLLLQDDAITPNPTPNSHRTKCMSGQCPHYLNPIPHHNWMNTHPSIHALPWYETWVLDAPNAS